MNPVLLVAVGVIGLSFAVLALIRPRICLVALVDLLDGIYAGNVQSPTLVAGVLALEAARLGGRLDALRPADSPWPARTVRGEQLEAIAKLA